MSDNKEDNLDLELIQDYVNHGLNVAGEVEKYHSVLLASQFHKHEAEIKKQLQEVQRSLAVILENSTLGEVAPEGVTNYKKAYDKAINDVLDAVSKNDLVLINDEEIK